MLRKITRTTNVGSMFWGQHWPHRWCVVEVPKLGQQQYFNCWNFSVGPILGQCQHANNDVLPTTPTITQCWPNDCLLSGITCTVIYTVNKKFRASLGWTFIFTPWNCQFKYYFHRLRAETEEKKKREKLNSCRSVTQALVS